MKSADKQKMCPHCEGRISFEAEICPYCAQAQETGKVDQTSQTLFQNQSLQDSLTSLYTPPYAGKRPLFTQNEKQSIPTIKENAMYKNVTEEKFQDPLKAISNSAVMSDTEQKEGESSLWPTVFMVAATNFFILGLLQLFFSEEGLLRLEWDGSYWFLYCLISLPLFYLGIKKMKQL